MSVSWKSVRVFISSTFRDMQAERDQLVRFVFPKLREELLKYRIHFVDVDLRWGVTSDQDALGVCREVIDECRPRFLCMLGGRYGWVPGGQDKSITADEIHYGVLGREGENRGHCFFYFRSDEATGRMEEETHGDFRDLAGSDSARKLAALKQSVIDAGLPVFTYDAQWDAAQKRLAGLEAFGNRVHVDLLRSLKNDPELAARFTSDGSAQPDEFTEEAEQMDAFIEERTDRYVLGSREPLMREMLAFAAADPAAEGPNIFILTGDPGSGKSAFLAKFVRQFESESSTHPSFLIVPHFIGASTGSTDLRRTLRRLCYELAKAAENTEPFPLDIKELITHFQKLLTEAGAKERVILVLDALNQFDATNGAHWLNWLPRELPPGVRIVASVISPADGQHDHQTLAILRNRPGIRMEKLEPLTEADALAIIDGSLRRYAKRLSAEQIAALLDKPAGRLPLYILTALEELRTLGTYAEITDRIRTLPGDARALFGWILTERLARDPGFRDRDEHHCGAALVEKFAACLGVSRHGLSPAELTALLDPGDPLGNVAALLRLLRPYLMRRGELLDFFHSQFREAAAAAYLNTPESQGAAHKSVANCLQAFADPHRDGQCRDATPHALSELPHHQTRAEAWPVLISTLENIFFLEAKVTHGMAFELALDFTEGVEAIPKDHPNLERLCLLTEALRRDNHFIARHAKDYPQALFQCLWNSCWWFDCPELNDHYADGVAPSARRQVGLYRLMEQWRKNRATNHGRFPWIRALRPPVTHIGLGQVTVLSGHTNAVRGVVFSPDGRSVISGSWDHTIRVWDTGSGREFKCIQVPSSIFCLALSPDGSRLLTGLADNTVRLFDLNNGKELSVFHGHEKVAHCVAFSPNGRFAVSGSGSFEGDDTKMRLWDVESAKQLRVFGGYQGAIHSVAFLPDGSAVVSGSDDGTVRIWDCETGGEIAVMRGHGSWGVKSVAVSRDGDMIVSCGGDKTVRIWDFQGRCQLRVMRGHEKTVTSVAFSPLGDQIASGSGDRTLRLWDISTGSELSVLHGHEGGIACVAFSPDGRQLASGGAASASGTDKAVRLWNASDVHELSELKNHTDRINSISFSLDGSRVATGSGSPEGHGDCSVRIWDATSGRQLCVLKGQEARVDCVALSPDGRRVASGSNYDGRNKVRLWDTMSGGVLRMLGECPDRFNSLAFSPDGQMVIGGGSGVVHIWDAETGEEVARLPLDNAVYTWKVAFSPDGMRIVTLSEQPEPRTVRLWHAKELECMQVIKDGSLEDAFARASGSALSSVRLRKGAYNSLESAIEETATSREIAWCPLVLNHIATHHTERLWAAASNNHLVLMCLEENG